MSKRADGGAERFRKRRGRNDAFQKQLPGEDDPPLPEPVRPLSGGDAPGRNDPCPCGSGKKYKHCCGKA
ncbi:MAG: SEC-C metal-binding domain-containing protein [Phycisphaerae bacterium]